MRSSSTFHSDVNGIVSLLTESRISFLCILRKGFVVIRLRNRRAVISVTGDVTQICAASPGVAAFVATLLPAKLRTLSAF